MIVLFSPLHARPTYFWKNKICIELQLSKLSPKGSLIGVYYEISWCGSLFPWNTGTVYCIWIKLIINLSVKANTATHSKEYKENLRSSEKLRSYMQCFTVYEIRLSLLNISTTWKCSVQNSSKQIRAVLLVYMKATRHNPSKFITINVFWAINF